MEVEQILRDFGLILGAGLVAQLLATITRVPEMILLVAAGAVASILLADVVEGAEIAVSLVALAVCATLLLQATTAGYLARRLGLIEGQESEAPT